MHRDAMRALYDEDRRTMEEPDFRREIDGPVVRYVHQQGGLCVVLAADLDTDTADEHIRRQIAYARGAGSTLEWKLLSFDTPTDMHARLVAYGFAPDEPETIMVQAMDEPAESLLQPPASDIRRITTREGLESVIALQERIWGEGNASINLSLLPHLADGGTIALYAAYVDDQPVASARLAHTPGRAVGGLWGGATLPEHRKRGLYTDLLRVRVQEALRRGAQMLTVDARPMSRPILEKLGFQPIATALGFVLEP